MSKLSKEKRDKLILICLLFIGVVGVLYTFVLGAQKDKLSNYTTQLTSVQTKISKANSLIKSGPGIEQNLAENRKLLEEMQKDMAPQGQYYYWFLKLLEDFRTKEGLDPNFLADLQQPTPTESGILPKFPYNSLTFGVRTSGRYHEIGKFLANFENNYPFMRIERVRLQPDSAARTGNTTRPRQGAAGSAAEPARTQAPEKLLGDVLIITFIRPNTT
jgi:Tfp pilus assembly protein PilO